MGVLPGRPLLHQRIRLADRFLFGFARRIDLPPLCAPSHSPRAHDSLRARCCLPILSSLYRLAFLSCVSAPTDLVGRRASLPTPSPPHTHTKKKVEAREGTDLGLVPESSLTLRGTEASGDAQAYRGAKRRQKDGGQLVRIAVSHRRVSDLHRREGVTPDPHASNTTHPSALPPSNHLALYLC